MPVVVTMTREAEQQRKRLRGSVEKSYTSRLERIRNDGCRSMGYRLTGEIIEHLCVQHLRDNWRVIAGFHSPRRATIILIGQHLEHAPELDVYARLYALAGVERPGGKRTKPPCCDGQGLPPKWNEQCQDIVDHARAITRRG